MANLNQLRREKGFATRVRGEGPPCCGAQCSQRATRLCGEYSVAGCATTSGAFALSGRGHLGRGHEISNSGGAGGGLLRPRGLYSPTKEGGTSVLVAEVPILAYGTTRIRSANLA